MKVDWKSCVNYCQNTLHILSLRRVLDVASHIQLSNFVKFFNTGLPQTMITVHVTAHTLFKNFNFVGWIHQITQSTSVYCDGTTYAVSIMSRRPQTWALTATDCKSVENTQLNWQAVCSFTRSECDSRFSGLRWSTVTYRVPFLRVYLCTFCRQNSALITKYLPIVIYLHPTKNKSEELHSFRQQYLIQKKS